MHAGRGGAQRPIRYGPDPFGPVEPAMSSSSSSKQPPSSSIHIRGARVNNLKDVSLDIPKRAITVFTGVSGSGKSSIVFDTLAAESQRLLHETLPTFVQGFLPRFGRPDVDVLENLSVAIVVDQARMGANSRSTVGTATDAATLLRAVFARAGTPPVASPHALSSNDPAGMCPTCEGLGRAATINVDALVVADKSLNEGMIDFPSFEVGGWFWQLYAHSKFFDVDKKFRDYSADERHKLLELTGVKVKSNGINATYEGLLPKFKRLYLAKDSEQMQAHIKKNFDRIVTREACPACHGSRLNDAARACRIAGKHIGDATAMQVDDLLAFLTAHTPPSVGPAVAVLTLKLGQLAHLGLGYLSLDRETSTLSGGESQRVKMVRHLGSSLTDLSYIFDEPSTGLHPHDVGRLTEVLRGLRDKGNTVIVVEHKRALIEIADHVVDVGPGAGRDGGHIVYEGDLAGLLTSGSKTGEHLRRKPVLKTAVRQGKGEIVLDHVTRHNVRDLTVKIPKGVLVAVTGVAGSGKSSLIRGVLPERFADVVLVDQNLTAGSRRSNLATNTGMLDVIRKVFAAEHKVSASLFSANSKGACPACQGLGVIYTELAHLDPVATTCEACNGLRFTDEVLSYRVYGHNISELLSLSVVAARELLSQQKDKHAKALTSVVAMLSSLDDVGLGYLSLGQTLDTLSGGERQRLKLASELLATGTLYVLDEPTTGLHLGDIARLMTILDKLVDRGATVIVIEHHLDVIARVDHVIDMGPGAGRDGGTIVFQGTPTALAASSTLTGRALAAVVG